MKRVIVVLLIVVFGGLCFYLGMTFSYSKNPIQAGSDTSAENEADTQLMPSDLTDYNKETSTVSQKEEREDIMLQTDSSNNSEEEVISSSALMTDDDTAATTEISEEDIEAFVQSLEFKELPEIGLNSIKMDTYDYDVTPSDMAVYAYASILVGNSKDAETVSNVGGFISNKDNLQKYLKAISLIEYGQYSDAYDILTDLYDFLDSKSLSEQILARAKAETYNNAVVLLTEGKYTEAGYEFISCEDYYDASEIVRMMVNLELITTWNVLEMGPAGGYIFYDKGSYSDGWRYLEAAPNDCGTYKYGGYGTIISNTSTAVGAGKSNTEAIVSKLGSGTYAAKACSDYKYNGYDDWFLPSKDELNLMYTNLKKKGIGNFKDATYWSSSEFSSSIASNQNFYNGYHSLNLRSNKGYVRSIRCF